MNKVIVKRFGRGFGAVVLGFLGAWVVGDDALGLVPDEYDQLLIVVVAPALLALEKFLRDGGAADKPPVVSVSTAMGIQPVEEVEAPGDPEPQMSARKLAGLRGTPEDAMTKDGQLKRNAP